VIGAIPALLRLERPVSGLGRAAIVLVLLAGVAGCGLKGPLKMPETNSNVVIRGPSGAPTTPAAPPPAQPAAPTEDRMPPPPLPGGSTGSPRGG
jgi:predicted small lipoprotein YifL